MAGQFLNDDGLLKLHPDGQRMYKQNNSQDLCSCCFTCLNITNVDVFIPDFTPASWAGIDNQWWNLPASDFGYKVDRCYFCRYWDLPDGSKARILCLLRIVPNERFGGNRKVFFNVWISNPVFSYDCDAGSTGHWYYNRTPVNYEELNGIHNLNRVGFFGSGAWGYPVGYPSDTTTCVLDVTTNF
jgi:hypothetical protein